MARDIQRHKRPKLFSPAVTRQEQKLAVSDPVSLSRLSDTNVLSTSSFRYDQPGTGLKSTQELPVEWSKFEKHTFFNSAQSKLNIAFDRVVNHYPFQGTEKQVEAFEDSLTGYEKYILDIFPKNNGYLFFSGTSKSENPEGGFSEKLGTYISVIDSAGSQFPLFSKNITGNAVINPGTKSVSLEMQLFIPSKLNDNQIVCQKRVENNHAITLAVSESQSSRNCKLIFSVNSGSAMLFTSASIEKGKFNHVCATFDRRSGVNGLKLYLSESLVSSSSSTYEMGSLSTNNTRFIIGSGSSFSVTKGKLPATDTGDIDVFTPVQTLSGALDDFRFFHGIRTLDQQKQYGNRSIYASKDLKLYFKFNEPTGSFNVDNVVLDSSGNSLHTRISNFKYSLRNTGSVSGPMTAEDINRCPILFPSYKSVKSLNVHLLASASNYDNNNPNLVTKLIPIHYLLEGEWEQGLSSLHGQMNDAYTGASIPGSGKIGSAQYLTAFLLVWAKFFDEMKLFIDYFSNVTSIDYDSVNSAPDKFLPFIASYYGFTLPSIFSNTNPLQFIRGENIKDSYSRSVHSLSYVQNQIWRRILINLNEIVLSKGTVYSIKSLIRAAGIDPDGILTVREYGGPTKRTLNNSRQSRTEVASILSFSGSLANMPKGTLSPQGFSNNYPHIISPFLSSSRIEVGYPKIAGSFVKKKEYYPHGISNNKSDGLHTSGSWTYEGIYKFKSLRTGSYGTFQSGARIHVSGSGAPSSTHSVLANLVIYSGSQNSITSSGSELRLYVRPSISTTNEPVLKLALTGVHIFDGNLWNVSFGRQRSDEPITNSTGSYFEGTVGVVSSSYFLRCARSSFGEIKEIFNTSKYFKETSDGNSSNDMFQSINSTYNTSGAFTVIGSQSLNSTPQYFLNDSSLSNIHREVNFEGDVSQMRFWSKALDLNEWSEHVRSFKSLGVKDPLVNFNFETYQTGSFQKIRFDVSTDQKNTDTDANGNIILSDFSQNNLNITGSGFESSKSVIKPETFYYSIFSPSFDVAQTDNKVRIRSYQDPKYLKDRDYASTAPVYEVPRSEEPDDDTRFTVEYSSVRALNEDIMRLFGDLNFFDDALGRPNLLFDEFYPDLDQLRKIYFKRLTGKLDIQVFFSMFKWFDTALGSLIEQLVPKKAKFLGVNFVVESHVLERNRFRYLFDEIYLLALERNTDRGNLFLSQVVGTMKKY